MYDERHAIRHPDVADDTDVQDSAPQVPGDDVAG